ncbi:MAG: PAS domain S-box protein, partial [Planctomycetota bacterium]
ALRALSLRYEAMLTAMPDIIMEVNQDKIYTWANQAGLDFFGKDVIGREASFYFEGEQETYQQVEKLFKGDENVIYVESWQRRKDGEKRLLAWWCKVLKDTEGNVTGSLSTARDITERRQAEEALRESQARLQQIADTIEDAFWITDWFNHRTFFASPAYEKIWGRSLASLYERADAWAEAIHPDDRQRAWERFLQLDQGDIYDEEYRIIRPDGTIRWIRDRGYPIRDENGQVYRVAGIAQDITERKRADEALQESEERYRQLYNDAPVGYHEIDTDGCITRVNQTELDMLGYSVEEMMGRHVWEFIEEEELCRQSVETKLAGRIPPGRSFERTFKRKDGTTFSALIEDRLLQDQQGRILGIRSTIEDITERKLVEEEKEQMQVQLLQAQKLESVGVMAGGIAHDFNNLLTVITGNTQMLRKLLDLNPKQATMLKDVETAAFHAADMTRALQTFSRPTKPQTRQTNTNDLIEEVYRLLRRVMPATIDFQLDLTKSPCVIAVDPGQVQQVLVNLCVNARDAMPEGGRLEIQSRLVGSNILRKRGKVVADKGSYVQIRVADNGCGMDPATLERIFDPFFTTKPRDRGTGLGLAMVYKIMEAHRGIIDVHSKAGKGTQFDIFFPASKTELMDEKQESLPEAKGHERILVVDDEEMVTSLLKAVLEGRGYDVAIANHPEKAIELVSSSHEPFHLAIVDYSMPTMTGSQCLSEIQGIAPYTKAILVSGYGLDTDKIEQDYQVLYKPFDMSLMAMTIRKVLDGK